MLQDCRDIRADLLPLTPKQRVVDCITQQCMLQGETKDRRNSDSIDDVSLFEQREGRQYLVIVNLRCSRQEIIGELTPNHSRNLCKSATRRNAVEPLHQCVTQRFWNPQRSWLCCALESA